MEISVSSFPGSIARPPPVGTSTALRLDKTVNYVHAIGRSLPPLSSVPKGPSLLLQRLSRGPLISQGPAGKDQDSGRGNSMAKVTQLIRAPFL